jgi:hypothetical protein
MDTRQDRPRPTDIRFDAAAAAAITAAAAATAAVEGTANKPFDLGLNFFIRSSLGNDTNQLYRVGHKESLYYGVEI